MHYKAHRPKPIVFACSLPRFTHEYTLLTIIYFVHIISNSMTWHKVTKGIMLLTGYNNASTKTVIYNGTARNQQYVTISPALKNV